MASGEESSISSSRNSSPYEKIPREIQEYPLEILDHEESSEASHITLVARGSADSARADHANCTREPLLPVHEHQQRPRSSRRFTCSLSAIWSWVQGPSPSRKYQIRPLLPRWQTAPGRLVERFFPSTISKVLLLLSCLAFWGVVFIASLQSAIGSSDIRSTGYGDPVKLSCHSRLW